eukprot:s1760_g21.t1
MNLQAPAQQETAWFQSSSYPEFSLDGLETTTAFEGRPHATGYSRGSKPARGAEPLWYQNAQPVLPRSRLSAKLSYILLSSRRSDRKNTSDDLPGSLHFTCDNCR